MTTAKAHVPHCKSDSKVDCPAESITIPKWAGRDRQVDADDEPRSTRTATNQLCAHFAESLASRGHLLDARISAAVGSAPCWTNGRLQLGSSLFWWDLD